VQIAPVNSLVSGNFTGNFAISGLRQLIPEQETAALQHFPEQFPNKLTGKIFQALGNFYAITGYFAELSNCRTAHGRKRAFLACLFLRFGRDLFSPINCQVEEEMSPVRKGFP
jgi:hypothetical protein